MPPQIPPSSPTLSTGRLVLRAVSDNDLEALMPIFFYDGRLVATPEEARSRLALINEQQAAGATMHWGMSLRDSETLVGSIGFYRGFENNTGEVGFILHSDHRGKGLMDEALKEVVRYGFRHLLLDHISAYTRPDNERSIRLLERNGFSERTSELWQYKKFQRSIPIDLTSALE